jgi:hypothetical protein
VSTVAVVGCSGQHGEEVIGVAVLPDGPWPGQVAVGEAQDAACVKNSAGMWASTPTTRSSLLVGTGLTGSSGPTGTAP